jgi:hypothetical protein
MSAVSRTLRRSAAKTGLTHQPQLNRSEGCEFHACGSSVTAPRRRPMSVTVSTQTHS